MEALKITETIIRENTFEHKKKKPGLNLTPGYALIGLRTTGPRSLKVLIEKDNLEGGGVVMSSKCLSHVEEKEAV